MGNLYAAARAAAIAGLALSLVIAPTGAAALAASETLRLSPPTAVMTAATASPSPSTDPEPVPSEPTAEPSPSSEPSPSVDPSPSTEPSPSAEPVPTAEPSPSSEPSPGAEPAPAGEPAPDSETETEEPAPFASALSSTVVDGVTVERIGGADRYIVAAEVSRQAFPEGAPIAFVASGVAFPDALSAAPAAVAAGGPLLLTQPTVLSEATRAELVRLAPKKVVLIGGAGAVSQEVATAITALGITVDRIDGRDRYAVSRAVAARFFPDATEVFIATGRNFPDALAAGGVAGERGAPVMLVDGSASTLGAAARDALTALDPASLVVLGGTGAVSSGIEAELSAIGAVTRIGGANRFVVAEAVAKAFVPTSERAFFAAGMNFPDSLAGAVFAGSVGAPLYLVPVGCATEGTLSDALDRLSVGIVTILGGTAAVSADAAGLRSCTTLSAQESSALLAKKLSAQMASLPGTYTISVRELDGLKRSVSIGGTALREPASVIKLFAAYAILSRVDSGQLSLSTLTRSGISIGGCLRVMIHISDNLCHADLLAVLGNDAINKQLYAAGFTRTYYVGYDGTGTWRSAKRTTSGDVVALLARLEAGTLLSSSSTALLQKLMGEQLWRSKIPSGVETSTAFGNKTGQLWVTSGLVEADAGVVHGPAGSYAISVFGSDNSTNWAIAQLSRTVFEHFAGRAITPARWGSTNLITPRATTMYDKPGGAALGTIPAGSRLKADSSNRVLYRVNYGGRWVWVHHTSVETKY